ncbi:MAG TPA: 3-phosphoshikimate 1-carboxyvinyltransferase [Verrucomicrobiae bacterium]|nr:3-phosphoshikimate 1-carboxyvinyltransferase [Verrucomicrobiae bacterium]
MSLPDLIEIVPLDRPVRAEVTVPGSKSITNRALILAALADDAVTLESALWSEDTQIMVECLQKLGFVVYVSPDPEELCNRTITVGGLGGKILPQCGTGTGEKPLELFVGNSGTAARFLAAFLCLGNGAYRLSGVPRMHERPQAALFQALRQLGYRVDSPNDRLPAVIHGTGPRAGQCQVSIEESSQFASALLMCSLAAGWQVEIVGENVEESPYVYMTREMCAYFYWSRKQSRHPERGMKGGVYPVDPDSSSGSYFLAAGWLAAGPAQNETHPVTVARWPILGAGFQIDTNFLNYRVFPETVSRKTDLGDSIMTLMVTAPFADHPVKFTDLGHLRVQECDRVSAVHKELTKCGAKVVEDGDTLTVYPAPLHGAEIETYNDHRMAMCFATLGLKVPGIKIRNPACVKKTFPNFFQKFAAPPPHGLGAAILDVTTGRKLGLKELFAD